MSDEVITRAELFVRLEAELSPDHYRKLKSLVGRALDAAGYPHDCLKDLRVALINLERRPSTKDIHSEAVSACRKIRSLALGGSGSERIAPARHHPLLPKKWVELLSFAKTDKKGRTRNRLLAIARALEYLGRLDQSPAEMTSGADLIKAGVAIGLARRTLRSSITAYRNLRKKALAANPANEASYAPVPDGRRTGGRTCAARLHARGEMSDVIDPMMAIRSVAPVFARQLLKYEMDPVVKGKKHVPGTVAAILAAASRLVGDLATYAPEILPTFSIKDLWRLTRPLDEEDTANEEWDEDPEEVEEVPLARWLIAKVTPDIRERCAPGATSGYPTMIRADLKNWFSLTEWAHGQKLRGRELRKWQAWEGQYRALKQHLVEHPIDEDLLLRARDKQMITDAFNMSHVWCVGLPVLMREAERFLDRLELEIAAATLARPKEDPLTVMAVQDARDEFARRAEPTLFTALVFYDGMRARQYQRGLWGDHFCPDIDSETGEWLNIQTRWVGRRLDSARNKSGKPRAQALGPGLLSFRVVQAYLKFVRAPRLIALGVNPKAASDANGKYPLFVSPTGVWPRAFSPEHLRISFFGATIYRMATEWFGKSFGDAQQSYEEVDREALYGVFGIHMARYVNATGCYKILKDEELARELTSDDTKTLEKHYVCETWLPEGRDGTWHNALSYRPFLERMANGTATVSPLDTMPMELLPPGVIRLLEKWADEDRALKRTARRRTYGSPSGRIRRPRPDVAERNRQQAAERRTIAEAKQSKKEAA